uniref:Exocyst complex component 5 n=1 Tax=Aceria tosichella TaxID=561515 RepID=A0A6G1S788_9ACAR
MNPSFISELEQEPFDGNEFIERIAWRATADKFDNPDKFDAKLLQDAFIYGLQELKAIKDNSQKKCDRLEEICKEEEKRHLRNVRELKERFRQSISNFHSMDKRLDQVADKVHNLGQQLEVINKPRSKAAEAYNLLKQFGEFLDSSYDPNVHFSLSNKRAFFEDAETIHKLYMISQELPKTDKFEKARERIEQKYNLMERELIEEFVRAYRCDERSQMREIATIMYNFKGYSQCIDAFIEQSLMGVIVGSSPLDHRDGFSEILPLCEKIQSIVKEVFKNPEEVMSKFLLNIYSGKLKDHIVHTMKIHDQEKYLNELYNQFTRTKKLSNQIISAKIIGSKDLELLTRRIFSDYLSTYFKLELTSLRERCIGILNRYYESKNHQKKATTISSLQEFKNKLSRAKNINISGLANINVNIGQLAGINITVANDPLPPGETLLSEEVAISLLHEVKQALNRNKELSKPNEAENAVVIFDVCLQHLCIDHISYAIELSIELMNLEQKSQPDLRFFDIVRQCNGMCHLIEKQFIDCVLPQVSRPESKRCYAECGKRKLQVLDQLELKLNEGLEKSINGCISWIKTTLNAEQKRTDFKPENEELTPAVSTNACSKVCKFVRTVTSKILDCLDGENVQLVYTEFGVRFYKAIYDHLQKFEFSSIGAMAAISDVKAYSSAIRISVRENNNATKSVPDGKTVEDMFKVLHNLCNLWVVPPENLKQLCNDDGLSGVDDNILDNFVQLRADFRTSRMMGHFRF